MNLRSTSLLALHVLALSGCIFGGGVAPSDDDASTSTRDATNVTDAGSDLDGGNNGRQDAASTDTGTPEDTGTDDDTGPETDTGEGDMGRRSAPYVVTQVYDVTLPANTEGNNTLQVARMGEDFVAAYHDGVGMKAVVMWLDPAGPVPVDTVDFPATSPGIGLEGDETRAYLTYASGNIVSGVRLTPMSADAALSATVSTYESTVWEYGESAIALEKDSVYFGLSATSSSTYTKLYSILDGELGYPSEGPQVELRNLAATGGGAVMGRRIFVAGVASDYAMIDFDFNGLSWTETVLNCGLVAAGADDGGRIVPARDRWALTLGPSLQGPKIVAVKCDTAPPTIRVPFDIPTPGITRDFDWAPLDNNLVQFALAWVSGSDIFFGQAYVDQIATSASLSEVWKIPGASGDHVRTVYNPQTEQWAVAVTGASGGRVYVIGRASEP